jgi:hypothetical protein
MVSITPEYIPANSHDVIAEHRRDLSGTDDRVYEFVNKANCILFSRQQPIA